MLSHGPGQSCQVLSLAPLWTHSHLRGVNSAPLVAVVLRKGHHSSNVLWVDSGRPRHANTLPCWHTPSLGIRWCSVLWLQGILG